MRGEGKYRPMRVVRDDHLATLARHLGAMDRLWPETYSIDDRVRSAYATLRSPSSLVWGLVRGEPEDLRAVLWFTSIQPGHSCEIHLACLDGQLLDKAWAVNEVIETVLFRLDEWMDHEPVRHVGGTIPSHAMPVAKWLVQELGFGGAYTYSANGHRLTVEGVRTRCVPWKGELHDLILLGRHATVDPSGAE